MTKIVAQRAADVKRRAYQSVNATWPGTMETLPLDHDEAISAAKRLWRIGMGKAWKGPIVLTSGHRYSYPRYRRQRNGTRVFSLVVNPKGHHFGGWKDLVHDLSHAIHRRVNPRDLPHSGTHERLEKRLVHEVVSRGWLDGKLKSRAKPKAKPTADDKRQARIKRVRDLIKAWKIKAKRADTALQKLRLELRRLEKQIVFTL